MDCFRVLFILFVFVILNGCIAPKSFIDPKFPQVSTADLKKPSQPHKLKLEVLFKRNGEPFPRADKTLRDNAQRILNSSGLILTDDQANGTVKVVMNNIADLAEARKKGFGTGLTFGLVGTTVTDAYELDLSITMNGKTISRTGIKHAFHTAIGNTKIPENLPIIKPAEAFSKVLEQMLLHALKDMQEKGELSALTISSPLFANCGSCRIVF